MPFDLAVIDLDNTLYAADSGVFARMDKRMTAFVARELHISHEEANTMRMRYWKQYGTTLRGLILHHGVDPEPFLLEVHDIGIEEFLNIDAELDGALERIPGRKIIHTNGTKEHAERVMQALGVTRHFHAIYDIRFNDYIPKPCKKTLAMLLENENVPAHRALVVDDMPDNLAVAQELGSRAAWVSKSTKKNGWDYHATTLHHLPKAITRNY
jgi:putative hydrolase of the HAD superfamily